MIGNSLEQGSAFCQALDSKHFGLYGPGHIDTLNSAFALQKHPETIP